MPWTIKMSLVAGAQLQYACSGLSSLVSLASLDDGAGEAGVGCVLAAASASSGTAWVCVCETAAATFTDAFCTVVVLPLAAAVAAAAAADSAVLAAKNTEPRLDLFPVVGGGVAVDPCVAADVEGLLLVGAGALLLRTALLAVVYPRYTAEANDTMARIGRVRSGRETSRTSVGDSHTTICPESKTVWCRMVGSPAAADPLVADVAGGGGGFCSGWPEAVPRASAVGAASVDAALSVPPPGRGKSGKAVSGGAVCGGGFRGSCGL